MLLKQYIETIEELATNVSLRVGNYEEAVKSVLVKSAETLEVDRVNTWMLSEDHSSLECMYSYVQSKKSFIDEITLFKKNMPNYFKDLTKRGIKVNHNVFDDPNNKEIFEDYINRYNIKSMIDVPLRSEGKMIGVICFERVGTFQDWTLEEQKFTQSVAHILSLTYESAEKKKLLENLTKSLKDKEVLLRELNHRVKNNMSVILSLLRIQQRKSKDDFHAQLMEEVISQIYSMASIQDSMYLDSNYHYVNFSSYLNHLIDYLHASMGNGKIVRIEKEFVDISLDIAKAIPCGLIANEIITNAFKYAFNDDLSEAKLSIVLSTKKRMLRLLIRDNGPGIENLNEKIQGVGLDLVHELSRQANGNLTIENEGGTKVTLEVPM